MTHRKNMKPGGTAQRPTIFYILSILLIGTFLYRMLTPAHEYAMRSEQVLEMVIDAACIVGLFGLRKSGPSALFWAALIAGLGLFAIRMHSDASWWTGHWSYSLSRR